MWLYNVVDEIGRDITKNIYIKNNKTLKNLIRFYIVTKIFLPPNPLSDSSSGTWSSMMSCTGT